MARDWAASALGKKRSEPFAVCVCAAIETSKQVKEFVVDTSTSEPTQT